MFSLSIFIHLLDTRYMNNELGLHQTVYGKGKGPTKQSSYNTWLGGVIYSSSLSFLSLPFFFTEKQTYVLEPCERKEASTSIGFLHKNTTHQHFDYAQTNIF